MRTVSYLGLFVALAALVFITPAIGQTSTRCVRTGDVTDCTSTNPKPPMDCAKIMERAQDLVPPYQQPHYEQPQVVQSAPVPAPLYGKQQESTRSSVVETGNDLLAICSEVSSQLGTACMFYIRGITEGFFGALAATRQSQAFCLPETVTQYQMRDVVMKWLRENPEKRHIDAGFLIIRAMKDAFPCNANT